jgi:hypothetical protein
MALHESIEAKYIEISEKEIAEAKEFYALLRKEKYETPEAAVRELVPEAEIKAVQAVKNYQGDFNPLAPIDKDKLVKDLRGTPETETEVVVEHTTNIFVEGKPLVEEEWDQESELEKRRNGSPYVISREEFDANETDFDQTTVTYYPQDDVLLDEREVEIEKIEEVLGRENLSRFGSGSGDNNVVYIRNDKMGLDFRALKARGSYASDMLGFDDDESTSLQHSAGRRHSNRRARRRGGDDE